MFLVFISSCKKDEPALDTNTSLLASHPWYLSTFADTDNTVTPAKTVFSSFSAYRLDDTYQFNADKGLIFDDGALRATTTDAQITTGNWQFQTNRSNQPGLLITLGRAVTLGTTGISSTTVYDILKLSTDTLRLRAGTQAQTAVVTLVK